MNNLEQLILLQKEIMYSSLVSVIMPAYNAEKYIGEAIESVIEQSYQNWELLIVDDCSSDKTKEIIENYTSKDRRIKSIFRTINGGKPAIAKNSAIEFVQGSFVAFLDSDDLWTEQKLEQQINMMKNSQYALCYTGGYLIDEDSREIGEFIPKYKCGNIFKYMLQRYEINNQSVMIKKEVLREFNEEITIGEDYNLFMDIVYNHKVCSIKEKLVKYRVHSGSITKNKSKKLFEGTHFTLKQLNNKYGIFKSYPLRYMYCWLKAKRFQFI